MDTSNLAQRISNFHNIHAVRSAPRALHEQAFANKIRDVAEGLQATYRCHSVTGAFTIPLPVRLSAPPVQTGISIPSFAYAIYTIDLSVHHLEREKLSSGEMPVCGDQWPMLMHADQEHDPQEPWEGLFRGQRPDFCLGSHAFVLFIHRCLFRRAEAYRHIFTSPSSLVERGESNKIGQCVHLWHDLGQYHLPGLCSHAGVSGVRTPATHH